MRSLVRSLLVAVALLLGLVGSPAHAADDVSSWTVRAADGEWGPDRPQFSYNVNPGHEIRDGLVIGNRGKKPLTLKLYAADAFTTDEGGYDILGEDEKTSGVGAWIRINHAQVTVAPGREAQIPFTITVPDKAQPGDHAGGIVSVLERDNAAAGMTINQRVGLRVRLRVSGDLEPRLEIEDTKLSFAGGSFNPSSRGDAVLTYTVRNTGNAVLAATQEASASGPFGAFRVKTGTLPDTPPLLPGDTWQVKVPIEDVHGLFWLTGQVTLTPYLTDAAGGVTTLDSVSDTTRDITAPWALLLTVLALLALGYGSVRWFIRRRRRAARRSEARVQEAVEAALREQHSPQQTSDV